MDADPLVALLDKLCQGDADAAQTFFRVYEPYLRMVVRRQLPARLRAKFDSIDIVQSVFADVLQGVRDGEWKFQSVDHLRAFLVKVTRNRFIDEVRHHRKAVEHERPLESVEGEAAHSPQPRPSELVQADDLWRQMLAICSPEHQALLHLKREGKSLSEIAEQTGLHPSSVRRILYELARKLAAKSAPSEPEA